MPKDTTPDPRDMERIPESQKIPEADRELDVKPDMARRPTLPEQPHRMAADVVEDESADPVVESGPTAGSKERR